MWGFATALFAIVAMMLIRLVASLIAHNRADKDARDKSIKEAENALKTALKAHPDDVKLHLLLATKLARLRRE